MENTTNTHIEREEVIAKKQKMNTDTEEEKEEERDSSVTVQGENRCLIITNEDDYAYIFINKSKKEMPAFDRLASYITSEKDNGLESAIYTETVYNILMQQHELTEEVIMKRTFKYIEYLKVEDWREFIATRDDWTRVSWSKYNTMNRSGERFATVITNMISLF
jgi:ribosomal 50S subunit-associated protein YjgA (DUF615 family)